MTNYTYINLLPAANCAVLRVKLLKGKVHELLFAPWGRLARTWAAGGWKSEDEGFYEVSKIKKNTTYLALQIQFDSVFLEKGLKVVVEEAVMEDKYAKLS